MYILSHMTTLAVEDQSAIFGHRLPSKYRSLLALAKTICWPEPRQWGPSKSVDALTGEMKLWTCGRLPLVKKPYLLRIRAWLGSRLLRNFTRNPKSKRSVRGEKLGYWTRKLQDSGQLWSTRRGRIGYIYAFSFMARVFQNQIINNQNYRINGMRGNKTI